jgi:hypothetical protein
MLLRVAVLCAGVLGSGAAFAEELGPEQARAFVAGKLFAYTCFDGTVGMGRILDDGSVIGTIRPGGRGEMRFATLPPNTLKVEGGSICAHLSGLPIEPCFRVQKIDYKSFRGSVSGFGFAYCDFQQHNPRAQLITHSSAAASVAAPTHAVGPVSVAGQALAIAPASVATAPMRAMRRHQRRRLSLRLVKHLRRGAGTCGSGTCYCGASTCHGATLFSARTPDSDRDFAPGD